MKGEPGEKQAVKQTLKYPQSTQVGVELRAAAAPVQVRYLASPAKITQPKSIHPRRSRDQAQHDDPTAGTESDLKQRG
jgi:hypothetical protein